MTSIRSLEIDNEFGEGGESAEGMEYCEGIGILG